MSGLAAFAETPRDKEIAALFDELGPDITEISKRLGKSKASTRSRLYRLRKRAAGRGWSPDHDMTHTTPDGFHVKGVSSLYGRNEDGEMVLTTQWVKTDKDREDRVEMIRLACDALCEGVQGMAEPEQLIAPKDWDDPNLMAAYILGDHHHGMFSWARETGADWDVNISSKLLDRAFQRLCSSLPTTEHAVLISVGDLFHADNHQSRTPQSGHALDTDSRHGKVVQSAIEMKVRAIGRLLKKHRKVRVLIIGGNHDPEASVWMAHCLAAYYAAEPRVDISVEPRVYRYLEWGRCLIGTTHGDKCKPTALMEIMAVDARERWGRAHFCHWYTGHVHHHSLKELRGGTVETVSVLPPGDAWHIGAGYRSGRGMQGDVWHKDFGRTLTINATVEYIEARKRRSGFKK